MNIPLFAQFSKLNFKKTNISSIQQAQRTKYILFPTYLPRWQADFYNAEGVEFE